MSDQYKDIKVFEINENICRKCNSQLREKSTLVHNVYRLREESSNECNKTFIFDVNCKLLKATIDFGSKAPL